MHGLNGVHSEKGECDSSLSNHNHKTLHGVSEVNGALHTRPPIYRYIMFMLKNHITPHMFVVVVFFLQRTITIFY